jgi:hypothetical protein
VFKSIEEVDAGLRGTGYIADAVTCSTVYLAGRLQQPILIEGPAGSGKTELACDRPCSRHPSRASPMFRRDQRRKGQWQI